VRLRTPVRAVRRGSSGAFSITLRTGEVIAADAVVMAVPLSILQRQAITIALIAVLVLVAGSQ
jgi:protoporphyrinogen oxidase